MEAKNFSRALVDGHIDGESFRVLWPDEGGARGQHAGDSVRVRWRKVGDPGKWQVMKVTPGAWECWVHCGEALAGVEIRVDEDTPTQIRRQRGGMELWVEATHEVDIEPVTTFVGLNQAGELLSYTYRNADRVRVVLQPGDSRGLWVTANSEKLDHVLRGPDQFCGITRELRYRNLSAVGSWFVERPPLAEGVFDLSIDSPVQVGYVVPLPSRGRGF